MAYKLSIKDDQHGIQFNARYENLARAEKPEIIAKTQDGTIVKERTYLNDGTALPPGSTRRRFTDDTGKEYAQQELTFFCGEEQVSKVEQTKVFDITAFQPLSNYTDKYVIEKFYEVYPDDNGMKKDIDRTMAVKGNVIQMRKLWDYLIDEGVVGRGEFNASSKGFVSGDGYIRAVSFGDLWGLEIGVFKESKDFQHLQDGIPTTVTVAETVGKAKKLRLV